MQLPALFSHEYETGAVARTKQYEIKLHHFLVDVDEDAKLFVAQGLQLVAEGVDAVKRYTELTDSKVADGELAQESTPVEDKPSKAATSKGKKAAK